MCTQQLHAQTQQQLQDSLQQTILKTDLSINEWDSVAYMSSYDSNPIMVEAIAIVNGFKAIQQNWTEHSDKLSYFKIHTIPEKIQVVPQFMVAYEEGTEDFSFQVKQSGERFMTSSQYFRIWKYKNNKWLTSSMVLCGMWYTK
jgi:hypothetical protein